MRDVKAHEARSSAAVEVDPITFEIIRHKLHMVLDEAIAALENVSGSPITTEGHDMMVSLYTSDGDLMLGGVGFLHHITSAAQSVKHLIKEFEADPGIGQDDAYFLNDPYVAALHPPDVYIISPLFEVGERVGFVANFVHVTDIGAVDPGGFSPNAQSAFQEGFQTRGLKIVEGGKVRRDVVDTFLNMVRDPGMVQLDLKSQLAANHVAKQRMHALYSEYGGAAVNEVARRLIRQSEDLLRERIASLPDGTWRVREHVDAGGHLCTVELAVTVEGDTLTFDFTGSSAELPIGLNCTHWATWGALFAPLFPLLAWDLTWNEGVTKPVRMIAPPGTVVNCTRPAPSSIATVGIVQVVNNLSTLALSKILQASGGLRDRATAVWQGSHAPVRAHGRDRSGHYFIAALTDSFCGAGGAMSTRDGIDLGGELPNVVSRWANVETAELNAPLMYLYRRMVRDSGGPGKYRGGVCHELAFSPHGLPGARMGVTLFGKGVEAPLALGLGGGYPGGNIDYTTVRDLPIEERLDAPAATLARATEHESWGTFEMGTDAMEHIKVLGGGGYGDPRDRAPEAVLRDVSDGLVSAAMASEAYGVVLTPGSASVDEEGTSRRRAAIREERLGRPVASGAGARQPVPDSGMRISEYLQRTAAGATQCTWCGGEVAPAGGRWKDRAAQRVLPLSAAGPGRSAGGAFVLKQFVCPGCATLLDTEAARVEDPPLHDDIRAWPGAGPGEAGRS